MFRIDDDMTICITRGDTAIFGVAAVSGEENYKFQAGDVIRFKVTEKKACENVVFYKDFPITQETERVEILLTEDDTKIGDVISKPTDYWYEVEWNPFTNPQTIIGYDDDGPKVFKLFPEGANVPNTPIEPEDIPVVDTELDQTSDRPVQNQAIARAVVALQYSQDNIIKGMQENHEQTEKTLADFQQEIADNSRETKRAYEVLNARMNTFTALQEGSTTGDAELADGRVDYEGNVHSNIGEHIREVSSQLSGEIAELGIFKYTSSEDLIDFVRDLYLPTLQGKQIGICVCPYDTGKQEVRLNIYEVGDEGSYLNPNGLISFHIPFGDSGVNKYKANDLNNDNDYAIIDANALFKRITKTTTYKSIINPRVTYFDNNHDKAELIAKTEEFEAQIGQITSEIAEFGLFNYTNSPDLIDFVRDLYLPSLQVYEEQFGFCVCPYDTYNQEVRLNIYPVDNTGKYVDANAIVTFPIPFGDSGVNKYKAKDLNNDNDYAIIDTTALFKRLKQTTEYRSIINRRASYYSSIDVNKYEKIDFIHPEVVYTVQNTLKLKETMPQTLYIDHMVCLDEIKDVKFEATNSDKFKVMSGIENLQNADVVETDIAVKIVGIENSENFSIKHISTKSNVGSNKPIRLLQVGDSVGGGAGGGANQVDYFGKNPSTYYSIAQKLFDLDAIRENDHSLYKMQCLGFRNKIPYQIKYNGNTYDERIAYGEGRGGWKLYDYLYNRIQGETDVNREPTSFNPLNPFYEPDKVWSGVYADELNEAGVKFSLKHYLSCYRTHDDNGNELDVGSGTGSNIHSDGINNTHIGYIVKGNAIINTPTHILQENGFNDDDSPDFIRNTELFIKAVRNEFTDIVIGIVLNDSAFGYFPQYYNGYNMDSWMTKGNDALHRKQFNRYVALCDMIKSLNDEKVYLLPTMFIQPTLEGCHTEIATNADGTIAKYAGNSGTYHPNNVAHSAWGSQLYAWLKYTLSKN